MRARFLTWFLFYVSCTQAISSISGLHTSLNSSTSNVLQTQRPFENYGSIKEEMRLHKEPSYATIKKAAHGGRGAGGGTNVDHTHLRSGNSMPPSLLPWSSTVFVSLALMLMMFFFQFKLL